MKYTKIVNPKLEFVNGKSQLNYSKVVEYETTDFEDSLLRDLAIRLDEIDPKLDPEQRLAQLRSIYIDIALELVSQH